MEQLRRSCIHHILVLDHCFQSVCPIHYPRELIQIIILFYNKLFKIKICCGNNDFVLLFDTNVYTWRMNQECNPWRVISPSYKPQKKVDLSDISKISCKCDHIIALTKSGVIYGWGNNFTGQLGIKCCNMVYEPFQQRWQDEYQTKRLTNIKTISTGYDNSMALAKSGNVYTWGSNFYGQLGRSYDIQTDYPKIIPLLGVKKIASGFYHSLALTNFGEVYAWGNNQYGQLGLGKKMSVNFPEKLNLENIQNIYCGSNSSMAITKTGEVYVWGCRINYQLELENKWIYYPEKLNLPNVKKLASHHTSILALTYSGEVYAWGHNLYEGEHTPNPINTITPHKLDLPPIKKITCGPYISIVITEMNEIYVWGKGYGKTPIKIEV
jgi:alpha-tubulin suppressor-like RCC1 family protein